MVAKAKKAATSAGTTQDARPVNNAATFAKLDTSLLDLKLLLDLAKNLYRDQTPNRQMLQLGENSEFINWLFDVILAKVKDVGNKKKTDTSKTLETLSGLSG